MRSFALILVFGLSACTQFPELDGAVTAHGSDANYPDLVPIEPILAQAASGPRTDQTTDQLSSRVAALKARANRLRGRVVDTSSRDRMRTGVPRG